MVGTGRFELPTPRTPSECSTRLSHVPTRSSRLRASRLFGVSIEFTPGRPGTVAEDLTDWAGNRPEFAPNGLARASVRRGDVFAGQGRAAAEEELLHLLDKELLSLGRPRLEAIFVE